ncbi:hypothetical protein [Corynebacterium rhinophilum]|uniref:hypothetical protein n=1 Tax=Corynebacterium rhinophilum TaxID=3050197 RepID=UPI00254FE534|nr:hypothetical protein [Corynebacterium sp. MSK107]MDK8701562.1 hypothetical protein [Corynebacterium sp. MSK107]
MRHAALDARDTACQQCDYSGATTGHEDGQWSCCGTNEHPQWQGQFNISPADASTPQSH